MRKDLCLLFFLCLQTFFQAFPSFQAFEGDVLQTLEVLEEQAI
jgi:hypothetical protein